MDKGEGKAVATSPQGGKKQKKAKKLVAVIVDDEIQEVVGPLKSRSGGPGSQAFLDWLDCLVETMGELTREVHQMRQVQWCESKCGFGSEK